MGHRVRVPHSTKGKKQTQKAAQTKTNGDSSLILAVILRDRKYLVNCYRLPNY